LNSRQMAPPGIFTCIQTTGLLAVYLSPASCRLVSIV